MKQQITGQQTPLFRMMVGFLLGMVLLWFTGCATMHDGVPRKLEADYGRSVTSSRLGMMVTPPNAVDPSPPVGMTPQAAQNVQDRYDKSFQQEKKQTPVLIGVGAQQ